jgi:hypothetical protein
MKKTRYLRAFLIALSCILIQSCTYQIYEIASKNSYTKRINAERPKKFVILDKSYFKNNIDVVKLINSLNQNTFNQSGAAFNLEPEERKFISAVDLLMHKQYNFSLSALNSLPDTAFDCQVGILKADCRYQLKISPNVLAEYQSSFDCTTEQAIKEIVKNRHRFTLYGF